MSNITVTGTSCAWETDTEFWWKRTYHMDSGKVASSSPFYVGAIQFKIDADTLVKHLNVEVKLRQSSKPSGCVAFFSEQPLEPQAIWNGSIQNDTITIAGNGYKFVHPVNSSGTLISGSVTGSIYYNVPVNKNIAKDTYLYIYVVPKSSTDTSVTLYGKDNQTASGNASISVIPPHKLVIHYYGNGATKATYTTADGTTTLTNPGDYLHSETYYEGQEVSSGLDNVQNKSHLYVERTGYTPTGYWYRDDSGTRKKVNQDTPYSDAVLLANALMKTADELKSKDVALSVYAEWQANTYTVYFDTHSDSSHSSITVTYASDYGSLPTPTRVGYTFDGWYTESSGGTKVQSSTDVWITQNHTLHAHWTPKTYTINYVIDDTNVTYESETATTGEHFDINSPPARAGWQFLGWTTYINREDDGYNWTADNGQWLYYEEQYGITSDRTLTLYARWKSLATMFVKIDTDTWSAGTPFVKTANGWKRAIGVFVKTADGWKRSIR